MTEQKITLERRKLNAGEILFNEGAPGTEAYLIRKGCVSITRQEGDKQIYLATRSEGQIVGEMALIDKTSRSATVTANDNVEVMVLNKGQLEAILAESPRIVSEILHQLLESLRTANDLIMMYAARPGK